MRRASWRSVPRTWRPPRATTASCSFCVTCGDVPEGLFVLLGRDLGQVGAALLELLPGQVLGVAAEKDVDAAAGHVRGDGHGADAARLGDDLGFLLVVLGVEDDVPDVLAAEERAQVLGLLDGDRADEDGAAPFALSSMISSTTASHFSSPVR